MNAYSMIPHHLFVAAVAGNRRSRPAPGEAWPTILVEPSDRTAAWLEEKRRSAALPALVLRPILSPGEERLG